MRLFLDSACLDDLREAIATGQCEGVTTNPTLLKAAADAARAKDGRLDLAGYLERFLAEAGPERPVSLEVAGLAYDAMVREGRKLYQRFNPVAGNVIVKIPVCTATGEAPERAADGLRAIETLTMEGIPVNVTLIMSPIQAVLAALAGRPRYVSPFAGRLDDLLRERGGKPFDKRDYYPAGGVQQNGTAYSDGSLVSGVDLISTIQQAYATTRLSPLILAASLRHPLQVAECDAVGADCATLPIEVFRTYPAQVPGLVADRAALVPRHDELIGLLDEFAVAVTDIYARDLKTLLYHPKTVDGIKKFAADAAAVPEYAALLR